VTRTVRGAAAVAAMSLLLAACAQDKSGPIAVSGDAPPIKASVKLEIVLPVDGGDRLPTEPSYKTEVTSPMELVMSTSDNFAVVPAGTEQQRSGHFHLSWRELDPDQNASKADSVCTNVGDTIPSTGDIEHFDDGETEATFELDPGLYRLCLQVSDFQQTALNPRDEYTIVVTDGATVDTTMVTTAP